MTDPDYLTLAAAGERAGVTANGVRRWIQRGLLSSYRRSGSRAILVKTDELEAFLVPQRVQP